MLKTAAILMKQKTFVSLDILKIFRNITARLTASISKIKSGMRMHILSKMEDTMKRSVVNISDVDESSASLPPRQR
ncbi:hypothetical protein G6F46_009136 [Rhizopus delemar]|uniref:Uncharacterized protein n=2 Tax=Rhizopus TaxID=4842 RepID=A0A9P6YZU3_9FUNG|nr:hypothetical protein G6F55_007412 [Rhizopus delemar]KAG1540078.1 hypothetical protein G6F51_008744 [Rhizopus arrhizus]KAG1491557.1 hypothetical protein G6F54_009930 [Rhizopus delemar]KAG1508806.1 hypothetical protein G6F53_007915 [Rhizopus delemar]KAG1567824.1 hypothetical protein G6F50_007853 [Rhizopus delemar]